MLQRLITSGLPAQSMRATVALRPSFSICPVAIHRSGSASSGASASACSRITTLMRPDVRLTANSVQSRLTLLM